ncbi:preprotein translocase subunit SecG [Thioclava sp. GXIMD4216]|uniref:Protein-export membrane protein SecG n=1 Tax=Thioclava litoralis TaxID=3076557 RepID=A0ABZ1E1F4_9RHOB|nr:preprotein translocase subunit SecG [Thioclava sp. FTW29]
MQNIILTVHLILALLMIGVVLLQRSEGGGLGMGSSGGGAGGVMTGRQAANALSKATWVLAAGFLCTSVALTVVAARDAGESSVLDRLGAGNFTVSGKDEAKPDAASESKTDDAAIPSVDLTPPAATDSPVTPPAAQ